MALIELQAVSKVYGDGVAVRALRDVTLELDAGAFAALAGPSGSGKTTLLNMVGALDDPTSGQVRVDGHDLGSMTGTALADFRLHHLGFIFQAYNLFPVLTVTENLEFVAALQGLSSAQRRTRALELLKAVGMEELRDKRPDQLSGGQQQRVAVLRAIFSEPKIVMADEPTANLDTENAEALLDLMEQLNRERGVTFLFSTHDARVMERARRVIHLRDGRVEDDGTGGA